jgi:CelD/BcsL family acetyltransferase involved in cellulose biosynthesis
MIQVNSVISDAAVERLAPEWRELWHSVPNATPFQSPDWLLSWWDCFGNGSPLVLTVREKGQLLGVLPLYRYGEPMGRKLLPIGISLSDYLDALVGVDHFGLANALLCSLIEQPNWDECFIPELAPGAALLNACLPAQLIERRSTGETCPVLVLPDEVAGLREAVPRKTLRDLRQARRRTYGFGAVEIIHANVDTISRSMRDLFRLHEHRWQPIAGHGVCADPVVQGFHLRAAQRMLDAGMLRLYVLRIGNTTAAAYYGFVTKGNAYAYLSGFDPQFAQLSPGTQIVAHAIEEAVREGAREFHFLRGSEAYKYGWGASGLPNTALTLTKKC